MPVHTPRKERRRHPRTYSHLPVVLRRGGGSTELLQAQTMNISEGGLQFVTGEPLEEGQELGVYREGRERTAVVLESKPFYGGFIVRCAFRDLP